MKKGKMVTTERWLPFADLVSARIPGISFEMKGIHSLDSVMVIPFRNKGDQTFVGIIREQRPLFHEGYLSAFPAGKVEQGQSPEEAARLEVLQEAGLQVKSLVLVSKQMPFLHICDEQVYLFVADVEEEGQQTLEEGEFISQGITWIPWEEFKIAIRAQQLDGKDLLEGAPMMGVSLICANTILALGIDPSPSSL